MFEIPATGCLLLVNEEMTPLLISEGLLPSVHFISYTMESMSAVIDMVLDPVNRPVVDAIRRQAQALVWSRHTITARAAAFNQFITMDIRHRRAKAHPLTI
jgi:hypothetical protein